MSSTSVPASASDEEFLAMLDSLEPNGAGKGKERRTHKRFRIDRMATVKLFKMAGQPQMEIKLCDVSVTGAGILSRRMFTPGEPFMVLLHVAGSAGKLVLSEARSCKYGTKGLYRVGVEFLAALADPEKRGQVPMMWIRRYSSVETTA